MLYIELCLMKVTSISVKNIKSFREKETVNFNDDFNILVGPNGSGKSNLLDIISITLNYYIFKSYRENDNQPTGMVLREQQKFEDVSNELEQFIGEEADTEIEICLEVDEGDVANISEINRNISQIENRFENKYSQTYTSIPILDRLNDWNVSDVAVGDEYTYTIQNYDLETINGDGKSTMYYYYQSIEALLLIADSIDDLDIGPAFFSFPPSRGVSADNTRVSLGSTGHHKRLHEYLNTTSSGQTSALSLAINKLAEKHREFEYEGNIEMFQQENDAHLVTEYLQMIGYDWDIVSPDRMTNAYEIQLVKDSTPFDVGQLSSGEQEVLNFVLGISSAELDNGLVLIDEPELHLHPKWQSVLMDLFRKVEDETNSQFIFTTHSSRLINEESIKNVIWTSKTADNSSQTSRINEQQLPDVEDLLHIIHSSNNEKMFFADTVVLVEGPSDRIIMESLIEHCLENNNSQAAIEVLEVNGKYELKKYSNLLENVGVENL